MLSHSAEERAATAKWIRNVFAVLSAAEEAALKDPWMEAFLRHPLSIFRIKPNVAFHFEAMLPRFGQTDVPHTIRYADVS